MPSSRKLPPRVKALIRALSELDRSLPTDAPRQPKLSRKRTIHNLFARLQVFGRNQIEFFQASYPPNDPLIESPFSGTEEQIGNDLDVIERIADQRMRSAPPIYREALIRADGLAYTALRPALNVLSLPPEQTVLTYFLKSPEVRVIPYAPVALIGVPFSTLTMFRDYLATPHEVGHYVYRHGRVPKKRAYGRDAGLPLNVALPRRVQRHLKGSPVRYWVEEVFADVYGCAVGGPVMAIDFQDLQLDRSPADFVKDDKEHPTPLLRPEVFHLVLDKMGLAEYAEATRGRWENLLKKRPGGPFTRDTKIKPALQAVVDEALALLETLGMVTAPLKWPIPYVLPAATVPNIDQELYGAFITAVNDFDRAKLALPEINSAKSAPNLERLHETFIRDANNEAKVFGKSLGSRRERLEHDRLAVLGAGGWTTKGPQHAWP